MTAFPQGLGAIAGRYDLLICDVWGVVHNGLRAWPLACEALQRFRAEGGTVVLLTNAPRPNEAVADMLRQLDVPLDTRDAIVTSGDLAREAIRDAGAAIVYHLGPDRDRGVLEGLDLQLGVPEAADIVLNTGLFDDETETPEDYDELIERMRARNLRMVCANPDLVVERGDQLIYCAGAIAERYEQAGGDVLWAGKPRAPVYERVFEAAKDICGEAVDPSRALAIGDALRTDIVGGNAAGAATLFIAQGIHAGDVLADGTLDENAIARLAETAGARPDYAMEILRWA
ncbi:TIGR01459 family HAD-type hydrolase [Tepidamorphus sp. 3E244]|uniref:TIGR01459 family HAD-type hydrolase n=1 Tax=Tepidamorphus sp. 3E244 TaxID=3385498 RepID=UPI0038FCD805